MAKEWLLNSATNRFQLNFKRNVGAVSEAIRQCAPKTMNEWELYYLSNVRTREQIEELGRRLFVKITEVITAEIEEITEEDCIEYISQLVIQRTYDGYTTEIRTVHEQLQKHISEKIEPAPDDWDRRYNVDFFIRVGEHSIGLQIKPVSDVSHIPEIYKERSIQEKTHRAFAKKYGGQVFYIFSFKKDKKKEIYNKDVIQAIQSEIARLKIDA
ncbi:MAG: MjaI family restriction endonuclease [Planctomycetota bacterium]